jgi:phosphonate transport system permease protein
VTQAALPPFPEPSRERKVLYGTALLILLGSFIYTRSNPLSLLSPEALRAIGSFASAFFPPDLSWDFLSTSLRPAIETVQLATAGVALALLLGFPMALLAAANFHLGGVLFEGDPEPSPAGRRLRVSPYWISRLLLNFMRSIPELIWALIFVRAVGLGPLAGILALGVAYAGILGKVFAEIMEGADLRPALALRAAGASRPKAILYGVIPPVFRQLLSYALYRWECGMRAAAIMGFVGAGGLGQHIEIAMRMFEHRQTATLILELVLIVALTDLVSSKLRRKLA